MDTSYLARQLTQHSELPEANEALGAHWLPLPQALDHALNGVITDAKTIIGLIRARAYI